MQSVETNKGWGLSPHPDLFLPKSDGMKACVVCIVELRYKGLDLSNVVKTSPDQCESPLHSALVVDVPVCEYCGKRLRNKPHTGKHTRYCSQVCRAKAIAGVPIVPRTKRYVVLAQIRSDIINLLKQNGEMKLLDVAKDLGITHGRVYNSVCKFASAGLVTKRRVKQSNSVLWRIAGGGEHDGKE